MVKPQRFYTAEDLWELSHLPENAAKWLELSAGRLIEFPLNGGVHGGIVAELGMRLHRFVDERDLGYTTICVGHILQRSTDHGDTVRAPDLAFVAKSRLPDGLPDFYLEGAPDLAIEVVDPNDKAAELQIKILEFLKYGTKIVVGVHPNRQSISVHTEPSTIVVLSIDDTFDGGDVLPGFSLPVREIFPE